MKEKRHAKILEIIRRQDVDTQEELCDILNSEGFPVTQATVSRDIRELKLTKISLSGGKKKYALLSDTEDGMSEKYHRVFQDGVVSIDMAQNILVIRTVSGMAMAVAAAIDMMNCREIVGSIAGDDTIMCAVRTVDETVSLMRRLKRLL
ncbi:MAG: arginine repressor [Clostridiales bacterium]|nr:arginine repressor [Clostridiales bacterium]MCD8110100.1 arginine repressor [Clostridiales bacterium]